MSTLEETAGLLVTRDRMVELLNEDLAGEYQAILAYTTYSQMIQGPVYASIAKELEMHASEELQHAITIARQVAYLGGKPHVMPAPVDTSGDPTELLRTDLANERVAIRRYTERIRQADELGERAMGEALREIVVQEHAHERALVAALGIAAHRQEHTQDASKDPTTCHP